MTFHLEQILYRAELPPTFDRFAGVKPRMIPYVVVRLTPCGAWIRECISGSEPTRFAFCADKPRFVSKSTHFAWPTEDEALHSLKRRVAAWYGHAMCKMDRARVACVCLGLDTKQLELGHAAMGLRTSMFD